MAIGDYIKYKTGLSQRALAAELGMNPNAIQRRFSGTGVMDVETLVKIADRFGLDLLDLMVESGLITTARAKSLRVGGSIRDVSNEDLMGEVLRRMTAVQTREQSVRATVPPPWRRLPPHPHKLGEQSRVPRAVHPAKGSANTRQRTTPWLQSAAKSTTVRRDSLVPSYDPYTHAHTLGVDIVWGTPGHGMLGRYDHASRTITLREGMRTRQERSVLAHELVHAVRGDEHDAWDASYSARRERSCDLLAAENLIDPEDLRRAAAFYPDNLPALAYELDVTEELLVIYLDAHPLTVAQA